VDGIAPAGFGFSEMNFQVTILKVLASYPDRIATLDALKRES
jgi:hypothetical protein